MILFISLITFFLITGLIHFAWALGYKKGFLASLPVKENGERLFTPKRFDCLFVAFILLSMGYFYLEQMAWIDKRLPNSIHDYGKWIIPSIFLIRAVGDFKYVGFFKRITKTNFGKLDTRYFSPLCLVISLLAYVVAFL